LSPDARPTPPSLAEVCNADAALQDDIARVRRTSKLVIFNVCAFIADKPPDNDNMGRLIWPIAYLNA
jgi:hypothetical protein